MGKSGSPVQPMQIDSRSFGKSQSVSAAPAYPERMRDTHVVRWYVLVLPSCHKGPAKGLQEELERRRRNGEPSFEYFAPSYVEVKKRDGRFVETRRPLLYNYVFIHASEHEIYRMKQWLPLYNFLPRIKDGKCEYHPYLSEEAMTNLQWVADSIFQRDSRLHAATGATYQRRPGYASPKGGSKEPKPASSFSPAPESGILWFAWRTTCGSRCCAYNPANMRSSP